MSWRNDLERGTALSLVAFEMFNLVRRRPGRH